METSPQKEKEENDTANYLKQLKSLCHSNLGCFLLKENTGSAFKHNGSAS